MEVGEFELIDSIRRRAKNDTRLRIGIGDDCSSIDVPYGHELLTSTDLLLEGVHFRLDWTDLPSLGNKAIAVNVSDIAAMGARPFCLHLGVGLPPGFSRLQVEALLDGVFEALDVYDLALAGGDTCRSNGPLMISVTVQGLCRKGQLVLRSGASDGDDIWVSGSLGDSALALNLLQTGRKVCSPLAKRHFRPEARTALGQELALHNLATAMLDLSDGLSGDLRHILRASSVGARIELEQIPLSEDFRDALKNDPALIDLALGGGEDYELLFTAKPEAGDKLDELSIKLKLPLSRIGKIVSGEEMLFCLVNGQNYVPKVKAFDHFVSVREELSE